MARYRKIDVRVWVDDKFRALSPLPPSGQALWLYLLTNPETVNIPGLYRAGEATLAEGLGWPLADFRRAFAEVARKKMAKADWMSRVVWIPNAIRYDRPQSANAVKSWGKSWSEIPECPLKREAYGILKHFIETMQPAKGVSTNAAFIDAFHEAIPGFPPRVRKPSGKPNRKPSRKAHGKPSRTQEQEQEQEQEEPSIHTEEVETQRPPTLLDPRRAAR